MQARWHHDQHVHAGQRLFAGEFRTEDHADVPRQSLFHYSLHSWPVPADGLHVPQNQTNPLKNGRIELTRGVVTSPLCQYTSRRIRLPCPKLLRNEVGTMNHLKPAVCLCALLLVISAMAN